MKPKPEPLSEGPRPTSPLSPRAFGLSHDPWGRLVLIDSEGRRYTGVDPVRAFPITHPNSWVSICDAEGREIMTISSLDDLPVALRVTIEHELATREFIPVIKRIVRVSVDSFPCDWTVETDRGPTRFTLDNEDELRLLGHGRVLITDDRKQRYQIHDVRALDAHSRRVLDRFL
jgi:hypothetical protein